MKEVEQLIEDARTKARSLQSEPKVSKLLCNLSNTLEKIDNKIQEQKTVTKKLASVALTLLFEKLNLFLKDIEKDPVFIEYLKPELTELHKILSSMK